MDSTLWYQSQDQKLYVYWPDMTIRDQNCLVCVNLSQSQNLYVYWPDLTFLDQIWRFGTRIVDSTQTPNQQSGWSVFFSEWQSPFWRPESTKWVPESTKWVPESTKGGPESTKGDPESTKWESQKQQIGSRVLYDYLWKNFITQNPLAHAGDFKYDDSIKTI